MIGLEVIPLKELKRPRLDVVPRVSGFFRDSFPNLMEMIDEAVRIVTALKEPPESNFFGAMSTRTLKSTTRKG